ncbi:MULTISPECIES: hypothetical protein [Enterococcus]|uniref:hypothetical protein n=1 Tax=Enterococcus TaxID=1350 RepID=UPI00115EE47F|nr:MULTISPECIES: hypothetical protein [Enterococcus]MCD5113364.1 hypothetical protein [Enterococcus faecium]MDV7728348.1 hypothetical protein [Enterococcus faecium]
MRFQIRYDDKFQEVELSVEEACGWVNVVPTSDLSEKEIQQLIQERIDEQFNRPEYNEWHRENRHIGFVKQPSKKEDDVPFLGDVMDTFADRSDEEMRERQYQDEAIRGWFDEMLKPKVAAMAAALVLDGYTVEGYAEEIGDKANNVSHRWVRLKKKILNKYLEKRPF